jgi:hypothetical protein
MITDSAPVVIDANLQSSLEGIICCGNKPDISIRACYGIESVQAVMQDEPK